MLLNLTTDSYKNTENADLFVIKVTGSSMRPFIKSGDYVLIKRCILNEPVIGNIVALSLQEKSGKNDMLCVHRLIWKTINKTMTQFIMKGDSVSSMGRVRIGKDAEFIGKVVSIIKNNRIISVENHWDNFIKLFISLYLIPWQIIRRH
ncbi:MAG: S24/S26 family peptidase [Planctomycetota bacterium]